MARIIKTYDNTITEWEGRSHRVSVSVNDSSGLTAMDGSAYFYAKKFPISANAALDISLGHTSYSNGKFTFDLERYWPDDYIMDLSIGDYVYEIVYQKGDKKVSLVQDRFSILDSLIEGASRSISISPSAYFFTIHDLSTDVTVTSAVPWNIDSIPGFLSFTYDNSLRTISGVITKDSSLVSDSGKMILSIYNGRTAEFDASFYYTDLILSPSEFTFDPYNYIQTIEVSTGDINSWKLTGIPSWLTADISSGTGNATITLSCSSTLLSEVLDQMDVSSLYSYDKNIDASFYFKSEISVIPSSISLNGHSYYEGISVDASSANYWWIPLIPSWADISSSDGYGAGLLNIAAKNATRYAGVSYSAFDVSVYCKYGGPKKTSVSFYAPTLYVDPSFYMFSNVSAETKDVSLITSDDWNEWMITTPSWIVASPSTGQGSKNISFTAESSISIPDSSIIISSYAGIYSLDVSFYEYFSDPSIYYSMDFIKDPTTGTSWLEGAYYKIGEFEDEIGNFNSNIIHSKWGPEGPEASAYIVPNARKQGSNAIYFLQHPDKNTAPGYNYNFSVGINSGSEGIRQAFFDNYDEFSISLWFKTDWADSQMKIFSTHGYEEGGIEIFISSNKLSARRMNWYDHTIPAYEIGWTSTQDYNDNLWHMAMFTYGASTNKFYVDSSLVWTDSTDVALNVSPSRMQCMIGAEYLFGSNTVRWPYRGYIDDIRIWNRGLSDGDVSAYYNFYK